MSGSPKSPEIQNRESWFKMGVGVVLLALIAWKVARADFATIQLDFDALLSMLLALFAIGLSVAFYLKATETSNLFYDNTYKFTKDISEILGRIEAGFGERLRHLDEGYSGLRDSVSRIPPDAAAASKAIEREEKSIEKLESDKKHLLDQIADRAKLQEAERKELFDAISKKDSELRQARTEIAFLRRQTIASSPSAPARVVEGDQEHIERRVRRYLTSTQRQALFADSLTSLAAIRERFAEVRDALHPLLLEDLQRLGMVASDQRLTASGARLLRRWLANVPSNDA